MKKLTLMSVIMMLAMVCFISCKPRTAKFSSDLNGSLNVEVPAEVLAALTGTPPQGAQPQSAPMVVNADDLLKALQKAESPCKKTPLEKFAELYKSSVKVAKLLCKADAADVDATIELATKIAKLAVDNNCDMRDIQKVIAQGQKEAADKKAALKWEKEQKAAEKAYNKRPFAIFMNKYLKKEVLNLEEIQAALQAKLPAMEQHTFELKVGYYEENRAAQRALLCELAAENLIDYKVEHMKRKADKGGYFVEVSVTEKGKNYLLEEKGIPCEELIDEIAEDEYQEMLASKARNKKKETEKKLSLYAQAKEQQIFHTAVFATYSVIAENAHNVQVKEVEKRSGEVVVVAEAEYVAKKVQVTPFGRLVCGVKEGEQLSDAHLQVEHRHAYDRGWYWE